VNPADLTLVEASSALARRQLASAELVEACLTRIAERDGTHSFDGDATSINAWVRVYEEDARAAAAAADKRRARGDVSPLCGIPIGLKDLYAVAGRPLTASSRLLDEVPTEDSAVWASLAAAGMVLLGHLHTHEFAAGATTDQVGNPWSLDRSAGGSSGGSAAALAARMTPASCGTDTAGSLRIPSAFCGISTIKPTRDSLSTRGIVPLAASLDHAGPMARTLADCALLLAAMAGEGAVPAPASLEGLRLGVSSRVDDLDPDVADGFETALELCRRLGAELVQAPPTGDTMPDWAAIFKVDVYAYHRRFDGRRGVYRPSTRASVERAAAADAARYDELQAKRLADAAWWEEWLRSERAFAVLEPTVPVVACLRGTGYDATGSDPRLISLTHHWNWTGQPAVALPSGVGARSGLPTSVSLIGPRGSDWQLLALGIALQQELGVPEPPLAAGTATGNGYG
jgi:aspartyl-tRNA(Asn)/glutamyl-tRNA(Gln) amidotransferase subunit A